MHDPDNTQIDLHRHTQTQIRAWGPCGHALLVGRKSAAKHVLVPPRWRVKAKLSAIPKARALDSRWRVSPILVIHSTQVSQSLRSRAWDYRSACRRGACHHVRVLKSCPGAQELAKSSSIKNVHCLYTCEYVIMWHTRSVEFENKITPPRRWIN